MSDRKRTFIGTALILLALALLVGSILLISAIDKNQEKERWNGGKCGKCKVELVQHGTYFERADGTTFNRFICPECHEQKLFRYYGENN